MVLIKAKLAITPYSFRWGASRRNPYNAFRRDSVSSMLIRQALRLNLLGK